MGKNAIKLESDIALLSMNQVIILNLVQLLILVIYAIKIIFLELKIIYII